MIVCHPRKLIFFKTLKVGGTSFEIALSKFCGPGCVITPLDEREEMLRKLNGGRAPQNYIDTYWPEQDFRSSEPFWEHSRATDIRKQVPTEVWDGYTKIAIIRNPYEVAVSLYFFRRPTLRPEAQGFDAFVERFKANGVLNTNAEIAPWSGEAHVDHHIRYEHLAEDLGAIGLGDVYDAFRKIKAKGSARPREGADAATMYRRHPRAAAVVAETCADQLAHFGYEPPV